MENEINPILAQFDGEPALLCAHRATSTWFKSCCQQVVAATAKVDEVMAADDFWFSSDDWRSAYRPYNVKDGILTIPVKGLLLNDFSVTIGSYATGYDYIWKATERGMDDPQVKGLLYFVNSGGGAVNQNFDLVDRIYAMRGKKPMRAFTSDGAYSAAYNIASAADRIIMGRSSGVGSIGVVRTHMEQSKMLENRGITVSIIRSKPRKYEGNSLEPLSDAARGEMQDSVDLMHKEFVAIVARNRGMDEAAVDATDALTFTPEQAIEKGLADEKGTPEDAFTAFAAYLNSEQENTPMADNTQAGITQEALTAAVATARAEGVAEGASAERSRISTILASDVAKDRPVAAQMFAFDMDMKSDDAVAKLAKLPVEQAAVQQPAKTEAAGAGAGAAAFTAAMERTTNPNIVAESGDDQEKPLARVHATLALAKGVSKSTV